MGHVVAHAAVAPRDSLHEQAVFVDQRGGHAVNLQLDDPLDRLAAQQLRRPRAELLQLLDAVGVLDGEHRHAVLDLQQFAHRLVADPLRGAVGRDQLGMGRFKLLEPLHELVVFAVADLRRGGDVVEVIMTANLVAKAGDLGCSNSRS